jgi:hypothetical protein
LDDPAGASEPSIDMMTNSLQPTPEPQKTEDARDLQTRLYREIGISAVAAALRFTTQPEPGKKPVVQHPRPAVLREDEQAA